MFKYWAWRGRAPAQCGGSWKAARTNAVVEQAKEKLSKGTQGRPGQAIGPGVRTWGTDDKAWSDSRHGRLGHWQYRSRNLVSRARQGSLSLAPWRLMLAKHKSYLHGIDALLRPESQLVLETDGWLAGFAIPKARIGMLGRAWERMSACDDMWECTSVR
ncbi:hypothetical protein TgHK011_009152 [Trichoderma gracile]|nr:hypothetical protein TgHK011_009152 [Trichoderma gracile]